MVDTLASRGDEGRARLRKVSGSRQETLIRKYPNGATQLLEIAITRNGANAVKWNISVTAGKEINRDG